MGCGCGKNRKTQIKRSTTGGVWHKSVKSCPKCGSRMIAIHSMDSNKIKITQRCANKACKYVA